MAASFYVWVVSSSHPDVGSTAVAHTQREAVLSHDLPLAWHSFACYASLPPMAAGGSRKGRGEVETCPAVQRPRRCFGLGRSSVCHTTQIASECPTEKGKWGGSLIGMRASSSALARNHGPLAMTPSAMAEGTGGLCQHSGRYQPARHRAGGSVCTLTRSASGAPALGPPGEALSGPPLSRSCDAASARACRAGPAHARAAHSARGPSRGACVGTTVAAPVAFRVLRVRGCRAGRREPGPSVSAGTTALTGTGPRRTGA